MELRVETTVKKPFKKRKKVEMDFEVKDWYKKWIVERLRYTNGQRLLKEVVDLFSKQINFYRKPEVEKFLASIYMLNDKEPIWTLRRMTRTKEFKDITMGLLKEKLLKEGGMGIDWVAQSLQEAYDVAKDSRNSKVMLDIVQHIEEVIEEAPNKKPQQITYTQNLQLPNIQDAEIEELGEIEQLEG